MLAAVDVHALKIRPATADDAPEVVRLAASMYESMGLDGRDAGWRETARVVFTERLGLDAAAFVADHPEESGRLIASGAGTISQRLPSPVNVSARVGYIQWVSTDPAWRGRGLGGAVMGELLQWYREQKVLNVELHATADGERVYRALGFDEGPHPALRLRLDGAW